MNTEKVVHEFLEVPVLCNETKHSEPWKQRGGGAIDRKRGFLAFRKRTTCPARRHLDHATTLTSSDTTPPILNVSEIWRSKTPT